MLTNRRLCPPALAGVLVVLALLTAGCWDRKEIENRGIVLGVAIDYVASAEPKGRYDLPLAAQEAGTRKYKATFELPKYRKLGEEKSNTGTGRHVTFSGEGESLYAIIRTVDTETYFFLFFEDLQIMVFSEAVARDGIADLIDAFVRDHEPRRRVRMFVAPGRAEEILTGKQQLDEVNSIAIAKIVHNVTLTPRYASKADLGVISEGIRSHRALFMPLVELENGTVKLTSAAVFNRDAKMVGTLNEYETVGAKIVRAVLTQGVFTLPHPANPEKLIVFELAEARTKVDSHLEGDRLRFTLTANFTGTIGENMAPGQDLLNPALQKAVEQGLAEQFIRQTQAAHRKCQELQADILDLGWLVYRQHPDYWKTVEKRWDDEVFPTVPLDVQIEVVIRRPGMVR